MLGKLDRYMWKMKVDHLLTLYTRTSSKWIKDLSGRSETMKLLEKNIHSKTLTFLLEIFFLTSPQAKKTKEKINKWNYIKLESYCTTRETITKMKRQPTEWENIFTSDMSGKGLISKIYWEFLHLYFSWTLAYSFFLVESFAGFGMWVIMASSKWVWKYSLLFKFFGRVWKELALIL